MLTQVEEDSPESRDIEALPGSEGRTSPEMGNIGLGRWRTTRRSGESGLSDGYTPLTTRLSGDPDE
ncbi:MAG TPA: hypothetical protein PKV13_09535 [Propionicimonas sp.]|nr:hypothetical protein [Propionicimonas sp.]HRA06846.1 hypothetical protein [Propionicimonas sp.]